MFIENTRARSLSRLEKIIEYAKIMKYSKLQMAYCFGMEAKVKAFQTILTETGFDVKAVSCNIDGFKRNEINLYFNNDKVSCNPRASCSAQSKKIDLTIIDGISMGHDILLQHNLNMDFTTLIVKKKSKNKI